MGCIIEGTIQVSKRAERKRRLGLNNILNNMPKWSLSGRIIYSVDHIRCVTFEQHVS